MTTVAAAFSGFAGARCVVTGGLGFIGSNLARALAAAGAHVAVIDALVPHHGGNPRNLEGVAATVHVADMADAAVAGAVLRGATHVFTVAGQVSHSASMADPGFDLDVNARAQVAFLDAVRATCPGAVVVHTSTRQVYGRAVRLPVDEGHPTEPPDANAVSKLAGEEYHLLYHRVYGLRACVLRLTNTYGPCQRLTGADMGFLPAFIARALRGQPLTVYGEGEQVRDCLHVDDALRAIAAAATTPGAAGRVYNVGHTEALSLRTIAEVMARAAGGGEVVSVPWPPDRARIDIGSSQLDCTRAQRELGWQPAIRFAEGITATLAFYREHPWYLSST